MYSKANRGGGTHLYNPRNCSNLSHTAEFLARVCYTVTDYLKSKHSTQYHLKKKTRLGGGGTHHGFQHSGERGSRSL